MAYVEHLSLTWSGVFGTRTLPVEIWSMGLSARILVSRPTRQDLEDNDATLAANWSELVPGITSQAHLTEFTVAVVGTDGRIPRDSGGAFIQGKFVEGTLSGSAAARVPLQTALVHSMRSIVDGPTGRGRFYLPTPNISTLGDDGRVSEAVRDGMATRLQSFVTAVNADLAVMGHGPVAVASQGSATQGIAPAMNDVVLVGVGRAVDTQRRRRGEIPEDTEFLPIV